MRRATVVLVAVIAAVLISEIAFAGSIFELNRPSSPVLAAKTEANCVKILDTDAAPEVKHGGMFPVECIWGTTYGGLSENTGVLGSIPEEGYTELPVTDENYDPNAAVIEWPFCLEHTGWLDPDQGRSGPQLIGFYGYEPNDQYTAMIWAMNDSTYLYIALEIDKDTPGDQLLDKISFYFDPDHYTDPGTAHFIPGNAFMVGLDILQSGDVSIEESGSFRADYDKNLHDTPWPDVHDPYLYGGIDASAGFEANEAVDGDARKTGRWHIQIRIPIEYIGCATPLGSTIGMAICLLDDENADDVIHESGSGSEELWWPTNIKNTGDCQEEGWDATDAMYMGNLILSYRGTGNLCMGDRLWGVYFDLTELDETTWLVLKNPQSSDIKTAIRFYESDYSLSVDSDGYVTGYEEGSRKGLVIANASMCLTIPGNGVYVLNLRDVTDRDTGDPGVLIGKLGSVEVSNPDLTGYMAHMKGITTGIHASSVNLLGNAPSVTDYNYRWPSLTPQAHRVMLINDYYTVAQADNYSTKLAIFNPSCCYEAKVHAMAYSWPGTADQGTDMPSQHVLIGTSDEVVLAPHQTLVLNLAELLPYAIASDPLFRRGSVEIEVLDGGDAGSDQMDEILIGTTWRYSGTQAYASAMRVYYLGESQGSGD